ncbi:MAG: cobalamin B12-binding domain-containing protein, partial [archaeon]|nr:cobalamin B12-binding domain-containing protein [archaeon]
MRFSRILLVTPAYKGSPYSKGDLPESGVGYIAQFLSEHGFEYDIMDLALGHSFEELLDKIWQFNPDLIGFSFKSFTFKDTYDLIARVKENFPNIKIVIGG